MVYNAAHRLYTATYDTGDFSQWDVVQNVTWNDVASGYTGGHYSATLSTTTVRQGSYAYRCEVRDGDIPFSTTERSEVQGEFPLTGGLDGDERWYQMSVLFTDQFPEDHAALDFALVKQFHGDDTGSPTVGVYCDVDAGKFGLRINPQSSPGVFVTGSHVVWQTDYQRGTWHDLILHIIWSTSDAVGLVELWHNGQRVIFTDGPGVGTDQQIVRTLIPGSTGSYYKEGYYRGPGLVETGVIFHDGFAVADAASGLDLLHERHNLCPEPVPIDPTDWVSNRTLTIETVSGFDRDDVAQITGTGSGGEHYILTAPGAATAGTDHTVSVAYRTGSSTQVTAYILYYNSGGSVIGFSAHPGNPISTTANVVDTISITGTTVTGTTAVGAQISLVSASTSTLQATMATLEAGSLAGAYFDGDTDGASWDGAVGTSTSTLGETEPDVETPDPDAALAEAVDEDDRIVVLSLEVDWDRDGSWNHTLTDITPWVTALTVERSATGDLPVEASLVEGSIAATLTATLGGIDPDTGLELTGSDGLSALETFAPYRSDSPLYQQALLGCGVRCDIGLATDEGVEVRRQFTGQLRGLAPDSRSREVTLKALDPADLLRAKITLPAHAMNIGDVLTSNHKLEIFPQSIVDYVLRRNGIYASPPALSTAQISCTGHGWLAAEAGRSAVPRGVAAVIEDDSWYVEDPGHPYGMLAVRGEWNSNGLYQEFFAREREAYRPMAGYGVGMGIWLRLHNALGVASERRNVIQFMPLVDPDALKLEMHVHYDGKIGGGLDVGGVETGAVTAAATATPTWQYVGLHFQHLDDGTTKIRFRLNGATGSTTVTTPTLTSPVSPFAQATVWTYASWSNLQIWYDYDPPSGSWPGETHTSQATISPGLNRLTHLPDVVNADSWQVLRDLTGAEYGLVGFDPEGVPYFRSREVAGDPTTVDKTVTADSSLLDLASEINVDTVRNVVTTETTSAYLRGGVIAESRDAQEWQSPPGITEHWVALPYGAIAFTTTTLPRIASASWTDDVTWGYVSVRADSPSTEITSGLLVAFSAAGDRLGVLKVWNYTPWSVRFATTSGSPALRAFGWTLVEEPAELAEVRAEGSVDLYGERVLAIDASPYRQLTAPLQPVAGGLLSTLSNPLPVLPAVPIVGDPLREIGDVVRLVDEQGQGSFRAYVVGIRHQVERGKLTTELTPRPVSHPGLGLWDDTELGIWDDTFVWGP